MASPKKLRWPWASSNETTRTLGVSPQTLRLAAELNLIHQGVDYFDGDSPLRVTRAYNLETIRRNWPAIAAQLPTQTPRSRKPLVARILSCRNYDLTEPDT